MKHIMLERNLTPLYVRENSRGFWKKFLPKLNQPHRGWGRSGFDTLVDVIRQQNGLRAFIMWWFLRLKFCILRLKFAYKRNKWK